MEDRLRAALPIERDGVKGVIICTDESMDALRKIQSMFTLAEVEDYVFLMGEQPQIGLLETLRQAPLVPFPPSPAELLKEVPLQIDRVIHDYEMSRYREPKRIPLTIRQYEDKHRVVKEKKKTARKKNKSAKQSRKRNR